MGSVALTERQHEQELATTLAATQTGGCSADFKILIFVIVVIEARRVGRYVATLCARASYNESWPAVLSVPESTLEFLAPMNEPVEQVGVALAPVTLPSDALWPAVATTSVVTSRDHFADLA